MIDDQKIDASPPTVHELIRTALPPCWLPPQQPAGLTTDKGSCVPGRHCFLRGNLQDGSQAAVAATPISFRSASERAQKNIERCKEN